MSEEAYTYKIEAKLYDVGGEERNFTSVRSLAEFLGKELTFWQELQTEFRNNPTSSQVADAIHNANNQIQHYIKNFEAWDANTQKQQLSDKLSKIQGNVSKTIFSSTPLADAFIHACRRGPNQSNAFWAFITKSNSQNSNLPHSSLLEGAILAYEFLNQDESKLVMRRDAEKKSLAALRKTLTDKTDELVGASDDFKNNLTNWKESTIAELAAQREQDRADKETFFKESTTKREDLEKTYTELLKLKEPARYWQERAVKFEKSGRRWAATLVLTTILALVSFMWFFSEWLRADSTFETFTAHHWQGIVLLAAVLSLVAFLIRTFGKLTFSDFHLQRDAEGREQLAYFYLSLLNDSEVSEDAKLIVYQSLFSRSETGLLSDEHGPVMPVADLVKSIRRG